MNRFPLPVGITKPLIIAQLLKMIVNLSLMSRNSTSHFWSAV